MAPKPAVSTIFSGLILLLVAGPVVTATWLGLADMFFVSHDASLAAFGIGAAVSLAGLFMLVSGVRRAVARREFRLATFVPSGPLAGRNNLNRSLWPSEQ